MDVKHLICEHIYKQSIKFFPGGQPPNISEKFRRFFCITVIKNKSFAYSVVTGDLSDSDYIEVR